MASQFSKRKSKLISVDTVDRPIQDIVDEVIAEVTQPSVYTQTGLDVYTPDGGSTYQVAEIEYNPATKEARVKEIFNISRLVGMSYAPGKNALGTLKKKK